MKFFVCAILCMFALLQCGCVGIRPPPGSVMIQKRLLTTGYCDCGKCCGWERRWWRTVDSSTGREKKVGITASGTRTRSGTLAADTGRYPFGTVMLIPGYGYGRVEDRGGAIKGDHIDLFFGSHSAALKWGKKWKDVKIWLKRKTGY